MREEQRGRNVLFLALALIVGAMLFHLCNLQTNKATAAAETITPVPTPTPTPTVTIIGPIHLAGFDEAKLTDAVIPTATPTPTPEAIQLSEHDKELLQHIAMAEMEGEGVRAKALCIRVVLNRVELECWPDTVEGVIFDGHQFSPTFDGGWERCSSPDDECDEALQMVINGWDESEGATYFRTTVKSRDTWHDRALQYLFDEGTTSFYKEKN